MDVAFKQAGAERDHVAAWGEAGGDGTFLSYWIAEVIPGGAIEVAVLGLPPGVAPPRIEVTWTTDGATLHPKPVAQPVVRAVKPAKGGASGANVIDLAAYCRSRIPPVAPL